MKPADWMAKNQNFFLQHQSWYNHFEWTLGCPTVRLVFLSSLFEFLIVLKQQYPYSSLLYYFALFEKKSWWIMSLFQILTIIWIKLCKKIPHNRWLSMSHHRKSFKTPESCCSVGCLQHTLWSLKETRVD